MGFVGKYRLGRTIGQGTFAKVKLGVHTQNGCLVAIKIIDKQNVLQTNLQSQVKREIRSMKLLHHPNIVQIYEVIATKTKIYLVMEYISRGQLSDKLYYSKKFGESEARKIFHQLIDAVDYCHSKGVYHRDLKPENLLLDSKGNIKVSDFGLSALRKPGDILVTTCGSPCYVAPELISSKGYDGSMADVWSCGVILFELLAGYLPFDDTNLLVLYKKICAAEFVFPSWFTENQKNLISRMLCSNPKKRATIEEIIGDKWFKEDYIPSCGYDCTDEVRGDNKVNSAALEENGTATNFINAFQLIAMSPHLDLSRLFEEQDEKKQKTTIGSGHALHETIKKIEAAALDVSLEIERSNNFKMKMLPKQRLNRCSRSCIALSAEVIQVSPGNCVIEISKSAGDLTEYKEFCSSLSNLLKGKTHMQLQMLDSDKASKQENKN